MTTKIRGTQQIQAGTVDAAALANTAVTPGSYGSTTKAPVITIDADGRITAAAEATIAASGVADGDKGDITVSSSGAVWTVDNAAVSNAKLADMAQSTVKGRAAASGTGVPVDLTAAQLKTLLAIVSGDISDFSEAAQDAIGAMVGGSLVYVDGTPLLARAALTGDVTAAQDSNATTIANDAVSYAKQQNVSAASKLLGRGSAAGAGDPQEISLGTNLTMTGTTLDAGGTATDSDAIHDNVTGEINAITEKASPVSADLVLIEDSAASYAKKKVQIGNLPGGSGGAPEIRVNNGVIGTEDVINFVDTVDMTWDLEDDVFATPPQIKVRGVPVGSGGGGTSLLLETDLASDQANNVAIGSGATWTDIIPNQTFTVTDANSIVEIVFVGSITVTGSALYAGRLMIDSAGTPITKGIGGGINVSFLTGSAVFLDGLAAGSHTVKLQMNANVGGDAAYCRCNTVPQESMSIRIVQHLK